MSGDFSEQQRNIIEKIAKEVIDKAISRPAEAEGEAKVPDIGRARQIAKEEFEAWRKARPPWWNLRRRLDMSLAGAGLLGFLILAGVDALLEDRDLILGSLHNVVRTEARVGKLMEDWGKGDTSESSSAIDGAFRKRLNAWMDEGSFSDRSRNALEKMAKAGTPELMKLVKQALEAQPILMFHGHGRLGSVAPVQIANTGCEMLVSYWSEHQLENLPESSRPRQDRDRLSGAAEFEARVADLAKLSAVCAAEGQIKRDESLGIPFWARFHPDGNDGKDAVYVLVHVQRTLRDLERTKVASLTRSGLGAPDGTPNWEHEALPPHPYDSDKKGLTGIRIDYNPSGDHLLLNGGDAVALNAALSARGLGFWFGQIDSIVEAATRRPPSGDYQHHELVHNLTISLPRLPVGTDPVAYCEQKVNMPTATSPDPACLDEVVQVVAMVMVNKGR